MKKIHSILMAMAATAMICGAHGPGHAHRMASSEVNEALEEQGPAPQNAPTATPAAKADGKSFQEVEVEQPERIWGASLTTGWESRHVHYGINETGNQGAWTNEVALWIGDFGVSVWNGFGLGNNFEEWDFTASYAIEAGPVFFIPGYNFRYLPQSGEDAHGHDEHEHEEHGHHEEEASHAHLEYNNELFAVLGTNAIPYITPSTVFIWNLNDTPGGFLEFRIDGDVPVIKEALTLNPYALLGLNFGYNTTAEYGLNNFQFGIQADWQINEYLTAFAGINYSIALAALEAIGQGNEAWVNAGVSVGF
jgi:hypothetical protein